MQAAFRILGEGQLSLTKFLWVLDTPVDLTGCSKAVLEALLCRFHPETDLYILSNLSMDTLDYSGPEVNLGSKGVMLGIGEPWRELPRHFEGRLPPAPLTHVEVFCGGVLVVQGPSYDSDPEALSRVIAEMGDWPLVVLVDDAAKAVRSPTRFLWNTFTRFEPAADLVAAKTRVERHHIVMSGSIGIDARMKPPYPDELFCDDATARTVTDRWKEYFGDQTVEMGDSGAAHLDV